MLPDFLGIGAQKAGTTWLWANLRQHPDVWLPPVKELHYFDHGRRHPSLLDRRYWNSRWFRQLRKRCAARLGARDLSGLAWDANYFLRRRDDAWYERVFAPGGERVKGDITPAYGVLPPEGVEAVHRWLPRAKLVLLLRDPIERAWSGLRMAARMRGLDADDTARVERYLTNQRRRRGDYPGMLASWERVYGPEALFVGFFEEVVERPAELLTRLYRFLGVRDDARFVPPDAGARVHAGDSVPMPAPVARRLAELYADDLDLLAARFGEPCASWAARGRELAEAGAPGA